MPDRSITISFSESEVTLAIFALRYVAGDIASGSLSELAESRAVLERVADVLEAVRDWE